MIRVSLIAIAGLAVALYIWVLRPDDAPRQCTADFSAVHTSSSGQEEPLINAVEPVLSSPSIKVVLDDGPRYPGEGHGRYVRRVKLAQMLKAFSKKAALNQEQERQVLVALYDLQQNRTALRADRTDRWSRDLTEGDWWPILESQLEDFYLKLDYILEPWQWQVWAEECVHCMTYAAEGILRLETDAPMKQES